MSTGIGQYRKTHTESGDSQGQDEHLQVGDDLFGMLESTESNFSEAEVSLISSLLLSDTFQSLDTLTVKHSIIRNPHIFYEMGKKIL